MRFCRFFAKVPQIQKFSQADKRLGVRFNGIGPFSKLGPRSFAFLSEKSFADVRHLLFVALLRRCFATPSQLCVGAYVTVTA